MRQAFACRSRCFRCGRIFMKKTVKIIAVTIVAAIICGIGICIPEAVKASKATGKTDAELGVRYTDAAIENWFVQDNYTVLHKFSADELILNGVAANEETLCVKTDDTVTFTVPDGIGECGVVMKYRPTTSLAVDCKIEIKSENLETVGFIPLLWADKTDDYSTDKSGNEYNPEQVCIDTFITEKICDYRTADKLPVTLTGGEVRLTLMSQELEISEIMLVSYSEPKSYSEYYDSGKNNGDDFITVEAEKYSLKSDSFIRGDAVADPALYPYNTYSKLINTVSQSSWSTAGQKIIWEFDIESAGYYKIGFRYCQDSNVNKAVFREIEIDGKVPYSEMSVVAFPYTGSGKYENLAVSNDDGAMSVYLEKGHHTLAMRAVAGDYAEVYNDIRSLMDEISELGMHLQKLTAGSNDLNRTWDMDAYVPDAVERINAFADSIDKIYADLEKIGGCEPSFASNLVYAADTLRDLTEEPEKIPNKTEQLHAGDSSANKYLGTVLTALTSQGLSLDRIYICTNEKLMPKASGNAFVKLIDTVKAFIYSFVADSSSDYSTDSGDGDQLNVWVNRSIQYVQVLQRLVDSKYNSTYGTDIKLSIMPSEQKLILSNATGTNPDVVLGVTTSTPFNLAIRGAVKNLLEYDDFLDFYTEQYNLESLIPFVYGDGVYGACEAYDFQVLFYRKDILDSLGLEVPNTWDDVKQMMPTLLRNSMNFYIPLSSSGGYKNYNMTTPFIYQNGGTLYSENGVSTAIDEMMSVNGFWDMTELYDIYAFDTVVASFYNSFRYGEVPIGISGFGTYIQLLIAAPELAGQWGIALTPGTVQSDGSILRSQMADLNACMIFENTEKTDEAWQFMKWWLSEDTQTEYALSLQTTYGSEYRWNTANLKTFEQLPYDEADKKVILEQWQCQMENIRHPANYMVEREISNIWNNVVINGKELIETIDESTVLINREIERKLKEFGYIDQNGEIVKDYATNAYEFLLSRKGEK